MSPYVPHNDESLYDHPETFRPERFLKAVAADDPSEPRNGSNLNTLFLLATGAENSLYITLSNILWAFQILPPLGEDGKPEEVDISDKAFFRSMGMLIKPYEALFVPRREQHARIIKESWMKAQQEGFLIAISLVNVDGVVAG
ncbi:uncharacterized protein Z518_07823 [Rhinocladiella mackenziei CBS 650.93]|uniref:Rhinocladiella mackenziei CBS 650.93 unplaced genomic scaffold supercont1.6, whole genome shotgun sequence n=1 Tax=Rhinocladiella mackenziei CBS 650.93 TaxID=1442369 RepID=A0A0D2I7Q8_9EURO|nr:uncharacterized protein Z518_07823 [Rhinocladiella mackenziei CBS 650.93]KIX01884.1 hypothetical protein Z518_07823 [Rhinocladiella mackenziei CBS 650.93]